MIHFLQDSTINVKSYGAKGDGITNDTKAIQSAINYASIHPQKNKVVIPAGIYIVSPIFLKSNITLILTRNTILKSTDNYADGQRVVNIILQQNILIEGNGGKIMMNRSVYTTGEQRFGLWMNTAKNVIIYNLICQDCGGDGFCIGGIYAIPCQNITLINCKAFNNRRNGLSITNGINIKILGGEFSNSNGTAPEFGIDLEPDSQYEDLENIVIKNVTTRRNKGGGISIVPGNLTRGGGSKNPVTITIDHCKSINDGPQGSLLFANSGSVNKLHGSIIISNFTIVDPAGKEINYLRWDAANVPGISFKIIKIQKGMQSASLY